LTDLTRTKVPFVWSEECENSYNFFKDCLTRYPILRQFDQSKPVILTTDASAYAIGAILSQPCPIEESSGGLGELSQNIVDLPVAYASRLLNKAERNYSTYERELLAVVWALEKFKQYTYLNPVVVFTDHKPLVTLKKTQIQGSDRLVRWRLRLEVYDFTILYRPGKTNVCADALSRLTDERKMQMYQFLYLHGPRPDSEFIRNKSVLAQISVDEGDSCVSDDDSDLEYEIPYRINVLTRNQARKLADKIDSDSEPSFSDEETDPHSSDPKNQDLSKPDPSYPPPEYVIDPDRQQEIIAEYHNSALGGHQGSSRTYSRLKPLFKWQKMKKSIDEFIRKCDACQKNKNLRSTKMPLVLTQTASRPFDRVYLDIVGGKGSLPTTTLGNKYILTFQDDLTKFSEAMPVPAQDADTIARAFVSRIILRHGMVGSLLTDQGANFLSDLFKRVCKLLKIRKLQTTPYHPQTNGALERSHRGLAEYLRSYVNADQNNWDEWVEYAMFTYNATPHSTTGYSPFELVYGRPPVLPSAISRKPEPLYSYDDFAAELKYRLQTAHAIAKAKTDSMKEKRKNYYDQKVVENKFNVGDWVLLRKMARDNKLSALYAGPYLVTEKNSPVNCTIKKGRRDVRVHMNLLIPYTLQEAPN